MERRREKERERRGESGGEREEAREKGEEIGRWRRRREESEKAVGLEGEGCSGKGSRCDG